MKDWLDKTNKLHHEELGESYEDLDDPSLAQRLQDLGLRDSHAIDMEIEKVTPSLEQSVESSISASKPRAAKSNIKYNVTEVNFLLWSSIFHSYRQVLEFLIISIPKSARRGIILFMIFVHDCCDISP